MNVAEMHGVRSSGPKGYLIHLVRNVYERHLLLVPILVQEYMNVDDTSSSSWDR